MYSRIEILYLKFVRGKFSVRLQSYGFFLFHCGRKYSYQTNSTQSGVQYLISYDNWRCLRQITSWTLRFLRKPSP